MWFEQCQGPALSHMPCRFPSLQGWCFWSNNTDQFGDRELLKDIHISLEMPICFITLVENHTNLLLPCLHITSLVAQTLCHRVISQKSNKASKHPPYTSSVYWYCNLTNREIINCVHFLAKLPISHRFKLQKSSVGFSLKPTSLHKAPISSNYQNKSLCTLHRTVLYTHR